MPDLATENYFFQMAQGLIAMWHLLDLYPLFISSNIVYHTIK